MALTQVVTQRVSRIAAGVARRVEYEVQKHTGWGVDQTLKMRLRDDAMRYRVGTRHAASPIPVRQLRSFDFTDEDRFDIHRDDIYRRFITGDDGPDRDHFGRQGRWVPRGVVVFYDSAEATFLKLFDEHTAEKGEARYLRDAVEGGMYEFLCPNLSYLIHDESERLRGYAIGQGAPISRWEFEQYIPEIRQLIFDVTESAGLYFTDLTYHNVVKSNGRLCFIDLESILPVDWYGTGADFAVAHLDQIDVGWVLQSKWKSPDWYGEFVASLQTQPATVAA
jgi:hypothetical protein